MDKRKALLIGDYKKAIYHPLQNIEQELNSILNNDLTVISTDDYDSLCAENLSLFDLCIIYADCWEERVTQKLTRKQAAGLLSFISSGGGMLVVHTGISFQNNWEFAQLAGARFTGHPPYQRLEFKASAPDHPIMLGIGDFTMEEEPYQFDFCSFTEKTVLCEYSFDGRYWPAAWALEYGLGRLVYLMPGHTADSFKNPVYRKLIQNSSRWALGLI